jgi:hypothetical protein
MRLFIFSLLLSSSTLLSQKQYTFVKDTETDLLFEKSYVEYVSDFFVDASGISKNKVLDTVSLMRSRYSADVFMASSNETTFTKLLNRMQESRSNNESLKSLANDHSRFFGHPEIFREPSGCSFPDIKDHPVLKRNGMKWSSEIFYQSTYGFYSSMNLKIGEIINKFKDKKTGYNPSNIGKVILDGYLDSQYHRMAIEKFGNGYFGTRCYYLISKEFDTIKNKWHYDVYMCHSVIMLKKRSGNN